MSGPQKTLYVGSLPETFTTQDLEEVFGKVGTIKSSKILTDKEGKSREFGFIEFENEDDLQKAVDQLNETQIGEKTIKVEVSKPRESRRRYPRGGSFRGRRGGFRGRRGGFRGGRRGSATRKPQTDRPLSTTTLFVRNLPFSTTDEELLKVFEAFKPVSANVVRSRQEKSFGYGFVVFSSEEDQKKGLELNNTEIESPKGARKITVLVARVKEEVENGEPASTETTVTETTTTTETPKE